ncbi:MAG: hypothetical protein GY828_08205 [Candidatus Gracilibacteria bacterium]|nr:hypothetical protein [Candidatus Gracilibacteria bacterium]
MNEEQAYSKKLFNAVVKLLDENLKKASRCWVKSSAGSKWIAFSKLQDLPDDEKKAFVYQMVQFSAIHSLELSIYYKQVGCKFDRTISFDLPDSEKSNYFDFQDHVKGV